jgi:acyl-ACP thioesterase
MTTSNSMASRSMMSPLIIVSLFSIRYSMETFNQYLSNGRLWNIAEKLIHITKMPIRWGDMDAYGHVNNTIYFRYMEQARVEWIEACRLSSARAATGR